MRTSQKSMLKSYNTRLVESIEQKYLLQINILRFGNDSILKLTEIIASCSKEYGKGSKGMNNILPLNSLLKKLFLAAFQKIKSGEQ